jgi:hypothetical protein
VSIVAVAYRLELSYEEALLADECAIAGLVMHDQSQSTAAQRRASELRHSVCLVGEGWFVETRTSAGLRRRR